MTSGEMDKILAKAADRALPRGAEAAAIGRVEGAILKDLRPVRPLAPAWVFTLSFVALFAAAAAASASALGMHGLPVLSGLQRGLIFPALLATAWLAAAACTRAMSPAAGSRLGGAALVLAVGVFPIVFALVFHDYDARNLVREGIPCLVAGLCVAIPTGLAIAWILRRGFVLDWSAAGIAAGALSGLAGLTMLELHCANLKAIHVIVWHVAVVLVSGMLGLGIGSIAGAARRRAVSQPC
jgi:hypothetical protein